MKAVGSLKRLFLIFGSTLIHLFLVTVNGHAQVAAVNGVIKGQVSDPTGAAIARAEVVAVNLETGFSRNGVTNAAGEFEIPLLPLGGYRIRAKAQGFAEAASYTISKAINDNDAT